MEIIRWVQPEDWGIKNIEVTQTSCNDIDVTISLFPLLFNRLFWGFFNLVLFILGISSLKLISGVLVYESQKAKLIFQKQFPFVGLKINFRLFGPITPTTTDLPDGYALVKPSVYPETEQQQVRINDS